MLGADLREGKDIVGNCNNYEKDKVAPQNWEEFPVEESANIYPCATEFECRFGCYLSYNASER